MSVLSVCQSLLFLAACGIVTGLPAKDSGLAASKDWKCPESCEVETDHPGCRNLTHGICHRLEVMLDKQKSMEILVTRLEKESENSTHSLKVMGTALFVIVPILFLGLALIILKISLPSFFKSFKKRSNPERKSKTPQCQYLGQIPSAAQNLQQLSVSNLRLPNHHQTNQRTFPTRNLVQRTVTLSNPVPEENTQHTAQPRRLMRQPSESTCPTESTDTSQGSNNLGISASNLHDQSSSSLNSALPGGNISTRTSSTTLPPDTTQ